MSNINRGGGLFAGASPYLGGAGDVTQQFFRERSPSLKYQVRMLPAEIQDVLEKPLSWFEEDATRQPEPGEEMLTQVGFVLDKSSSMSVGKTVTIAGFNEQLGRVREGAEQVAGATQMTFTQFSHEVVVSYAGASVDVVQPLTVETYCPGGSTALFDGIGDTLAALLSLPRINSAACATLVTIFTDGEENCSVRYSAAMLQDLIKKLEATKRWTFALIGPKRGVDSLASLLSVAKSNVTGFEPHSVESRNAVMGAIAQASSSYMTTRSMGASQVFGLYDQGQKP